MIKNQIYQLLSQSQEIDELVAGKIHWLVNQNDQETDYIVYQLIDHQRPLDAQLDPDIQTAQVQIDAYSKHEDTALQIGKAILTLHGIQRPEIAPNIQLIEVDTESSGYGEQTRLYRANFTFSVYFT